ATRLVDREVIEVHEPLPGPRSGGLAAAERAALQGQADVKGSVARSVVEDVDADLHVELVPGRLVRRRTNVECQRVRGARRWWWRWRRWCLVLDRERRVVALAVVGPRHRMRSWLIRRARVAVARPVGRDREARVDRDVAHRAAIGIERLHRVRLGASGLDRRVGGGDDDVIEDRLRRSDPDDLALRVLLALRVRHGERHGVPAGIVIRVRRSLVARLRRSVTETPMPRQGIAVGVVRRIREPDTQRSWSEPWGCREPSLRGLVERWRRRRTAGRAALTAGRAALTTGRAALTARARGGGRRDRPLLPLAGSLRRFGGSLGPASAAFDALRGVV